MSTALAMRSPARLAPASPDGSATALQTLAGSVSAFFSLESFDRRSGIATYGLRVVNATKSALICRTWIVSRRGDTALAHPVLFEVAPLSTAATLVPVRARDFASFDRALAEIAGDGVHCLVEAPAPPRWVPYLAAGRVAGACVLFGLLALAAAGTLRAELPRITAFAVTPQTLPGTTVRAQYDVAGDGRLSYTVLAPDGRQIQGGSLSQRSGSIPVAIPGSKDSGAYTLEMVMDGPLGTATATRVINTVSAAANRVAAIDAISVTPAVAKPGETITVAYLAAGSRGYVRLMGTDGTIWQEKPFSRDGQTQFVVPPVAGLREMRVLLHVSKGRSVAQTVAGVAVAQPGAAAHSGPPAAIGQVAGDDESGLPAPSAQNGVFEVLDRTVRGGESVRVKIISPRNGMHVALTDAQSHEVAGTDAGDQTTEVTLRAPAVSVPARYTVVASFTDGFGQESIVEPVTVVP